MSRLVITLVAASLLAGCNDARTESAADGGAPRKLSSSQKDSLLRVQDSMLAERTRQLSEQSQLIGDAATSARLVAEIDNDLAKVRDLKYSRDGMTRRTDMEGGTASEQLDMVGRKVRAMIARLNESEARARRLRTQAKAHSKEDSAQLARLTEYERAIGELRETLERQRMEITSLTQQVDSIGRVNAVLVARTNEMSAREDSVFIAIGSEKELMRRGLVKKEGGTKLLFGRGKTLVAARDLNPEQFRAVSKSHATSIELPNPGKAYRIVTRQSLRYATPQSRKDGLVRGTLTIAEPLSFWAPSKFLILVER